MPDESARPITVASFNLFLSEHRLMATRCPSCQSLFLPPRAICPVCHGMELEWTALNGSGKLAAFTSIYVGPSVMCAAGYDRNNPYLAGIAQLAEGVKISARILGLDARTPDVGWIGLPLTVEFIDCGEGESRTTRLAFRASA